MRGGAVLNRQQCRKNRLRSWKSKRSAGSPAATSREHGWSKIKPVGFEAVCVQHATAAYANSHHALPAPEAMWIGGITGKNASGYVLGGVREEPEELKKT